ncbi:MAG: hypothetical protein H6Q39_420 [Chloroflexi bacterium]|nr:hypothetical protein [Chloroflexota bacterium]
MFKVKAAVVDFLGDKEKYPCHHQHRLGDEFIFDGASFHGTICPSLAITVVPRMMELHSAGPRYRDYLYYYPFLYAPVSLEDPDLKKYDGLGFRNVLQTYAESKYHMANLVGTEAFKWPPLAERTAFKDINIICPDYRTAVVMKLEAFDLSDKGRNIPYFRRQMLILDKVWKKPGVAAEKIIREFSKEQIEGIYPALSPIMVMALREELELTGYLELRDGKTFITAKGKAKLNSFKKGLSGEERAALQIEI